MARNIIQSFDIWTDAQGVKSKGRVKSIENISLEGIVRLREIILELAIRGKLVPQDPNDKPASELLKKIQGEKEKLTKQKLIGKQTKLSPISDNIKYFQIPESWEWTRLGNISYQITDGAHHTPNYVSEGIPFLSVKDVSSGFIDFTQTRYISQKQHQELTKRCNPQKGDLLLTKVGTTGIPVLIETDIPFSLFVSIALVKFAKEHIYGNFLTLLIKSPLVKTQSSEGTEGIGNKNLVLRKIVSFKIVVPPLEEQKRIVTKVNELMTLCEKLEKQQTNNLKTHQSLVKTFLEKLTQAANTKKPKIVWERISNNFNTLFCTEDSIDQLKQTILQLAVMGKLVSQDSKDEPAIEVIKKIAKEKEKLIKNGKIKTQTPLPEITNEERPFELPENWEWSRLGAIGIGSTGKTPSTSVSKYFGGDIPFLGPGQITSDGIISEYDKTLTIEGSTNSTVAEKDDILMVCIGGSIGKCAVVKSKVSFNQQLNCIRPVLIETNFLFKIMTSSYFQESILSKATGSATPIINRSKWEEILIPIPPISEQKRIVSKVDELLSLCNAIKEKIIKLQHIKVLLSETVSVPKSQTV